MGSMHTMLEETPGGHHRAAVFYAERAKADVGLIVTGGISPNSQGVVFTGSAKLSIESEIENHIPITKAVHESGGKICMQILHTGRYAYHKDCVAPSAIKAPINMITPRELTTQEVYDTIKDYVNCAKLAQQAGYDGVEIMGSEGYLINQFIVSRTNHRTDEWGGSYTNRMRFPVEIVQAVRKAVGTDFIIIYRLSMLDLVEGGSSWDEVVILAKAIENAGATIINTGIGWHEARVPTIATVVPQGGFSWVTKNMMGEVNIPLVATNRINTPEIAEHILENNHADMVSMARPFLADPEFVLKAKEGRAHEINTCIACNQACLDHTFAMQVCSCLVNPRACHETILNYHPTENPKKIAVVGAGPAGMAASTILAERGHSVTLYEASDKIGGQFNLAKVIPGKEDYKETIRYYGAMMDKYDVSLQTGKRIDATELATKGFDEIVIATGVHPRKIDLESKPHPKVVGYTDILESKVIAGSSVAIIGAGGIGFDVASFLLGDHSSEDVEAYMHKWGVDTSLEERGAYTKPNFSPPKRKIYLLKRSVGKHGKSLGKTTGWIHKAHLKLSEVQMVSNVEYVKVDDMGLHIRQGTEQKLLEVDHVIICAGQVKNDTLYNELKKLTDIPVHVIGGAAEAKELDAKKAINEAAFLAAKI